MYSGERVHVRVDEASMIQEALLDPESTGILIAGEPGIGKHELIKSIPEMDDRHGSVIKLLCSPTLSSTPYGVLAPMLSANSDELPDVAVLRQIISAVRNQLKECPEGEGLIILIDEAQYIDASSAFILAQLVHSKLVKLVVLTTEKYMDELSLESLLTGAGLERIHLGKFDVVETQELCSALLPGAVTLGTARIIFGQTSGNPFLIRHFVEAALRQGLLTEIHGFWVLNRATVIPDLLLREAVRGLHKRYSPTEQNALELLSLAGRLPIAELRTLTGLELSEEDRVGLIQLEMGTASIASPFYSKVMRTLILPGQNQLLRQRFRVIRDQLRPLEFEELLWSIESGETPEPQSIEQFLRLANDNGRHEEAWEIAQNCAGEAITDGIIIERIRAIFGQENSRSTPHRLAAALLLISESVSKGKLLNSRRIVRWLIADQEIEIPSDVHEETVGQETTSSGESEQSDFIDEIFINAIEYSRKKYEESDTDSAYRGATKPIILDGSTLIRPVYYRLALAVIAARSATASGKYEEALEIVEGFSFGTPTDILHAHGSLMFCKTLNYLLQGQLADAQSTCRESISELEVVDPEDLLDLAWGLNAYLAGENIGSHVGIPPSGPSRDFQDRDPADSVKDRDADYWLGSIYHELSLNEPRIQNIFASLDALKEYSHKVHELEALFLCWSAPSISKMSQQFAERFIELAEPSQNKRQKALTNLIRLAISEDTEGLQSFATWAYSHDEKACAVEALARLVGLLAENSSSRQQGIILRQMDGWIEEMGGVSWGYAARILNARGLTTREWEIVELARTGMSNKEIANNLTVSQRTIEGHLYRIFAKLGVSTRHELKGLKLRRHS